MRPHGSFRQVWTLLLTLLALSIGVQSGQAIILYGLDNSANTSDPGVGLPWNSVGTLTNSTGTAVAPSAIYLGNGYMLTAAHVNMSGLGYVKFSDTGIFAIDSTFTPVTPVAGVDMKIFKLAVQPMLDPVQLLFTDDETTAPSYMVGWGVGRNPAEPLGDTSVAWGGDATAAHRWGINKPLTVITSSGSQLIVTAAGSSSGSPAGVGNNEGAMTVGDSGSALFQQIGGNWYLIGLGVGVQTNYVSTFGNDQFGGVHGDHNYYVRISAYAEEIDEIIAIPEPSTLLLFGLAGATLIGSHFRRRRHR